MFTCSEHYIDSLLEEDCPYMDLTVEALGIGDAAGNMTYWSKAPCVLAGVDEARRLLEHAGCRVECTGRSGQRVAAGEVFMRTWGTARQIHRGLKISQNVLEYASGIASRTAQMLERARTVAPGIHVAVTRKNFPGTKRLSLSAALAGGAVVHRLGLSDSMLEFDQHSVFMGGMDAFAAEVARVREVFPERKLCAEVATMQEALLLAPTGIDSIQCERFSPEELTQTVPAVKALNPRALVLAAGDVNGDNAAEYAATGVDVLVTSWVYFGRPQDIKIAVAAG